jgi:hypothetical protein
MPNPDAATAPWDGAPLLPNQMSYDAPGDAGPYVYDQVTRLTWQQWASPLFPDYLHALVYCDGLPPLGRTHWRVPTRIELVSLIDFTQETLLNPIAFPEAGQPPGVFWSSSVIPGDPGSDAALAHWVVSFLDGTVTPAAADSSAVVLCVNDGGPP